jgi:hypothetical protein
MHRLVYLCDWLPPDFGAVGQYSLLFARERAAAGEDVVLAGLATAGGSVTAEAIGGGRLRVVRRRAAPYDRANFRARARWTLGTNLSLLWGVRRELARADEILITGSPPFLLHLAGPLAALLGKPLTYRITDFHPECLMAERGELDERGEPGKRQARGAAGIGLAAFHRLTVALRRRLVDRFEVLGEDQRQRLLALGIPAARIVLKRDPSPVAIPPGTPPLDRPAELAGRCLLLYSGNFGVAHDHATFVAGYRRHHQAGTGRVGLWLNATGARADLVESELRAAGLPLHRGRPVPLADLPRLLVTPDAHLITLRDPFVGYVLPSKIYGCLASGRDLLYVGSRRSDIHLLATEAALSPAPAAPVDPADPAAPAAPPAAAGSAYFQVETGDAAGVAAALEALADRADALAAHAARRTLR